MQKVMSPRLLDISRASTYLGMSEGCLRMKLSRKQLPDTMVRRIGSRIYLDKVALDKFLDGPNSSLSHAERVINSVETEVREGIAKK